MYSIFLNVNANANVKYSLVGSYFSGAPRGHQLIFFIIKFFTIRQKYPHHHYSKKKMFSLISAAKTRITTAFSVNTFNTSNTLQSILLRGYKTHQGARKRWRKAANGTFKRKQCGRLHGNVGWSKARNLNHLNDTVLAKGHGKGNHKKKLQRMLPHHH